MTLVYLPMVGRLQVHKLATQAFRHLDRIIRRHAYFVRRAVTGTYNCRKITGGSSFSSHAWGTSIDVNWDTNPYRLDKLVTDMPRAMVAELQDLKTRLTKTPVWRWGGDWDGRPDTPHSNYDAMHWEIIATPGELVEGIEFPAFDMKMPAAAPLLQRGDRGAAVRILQTVLLADAQDGIFGPKTDALVREFQASRGLAADGLVGPGTWTAFMSNAPRVLGNTPHPFKGRPPA